MAKATDWNKISKTAKAQNLGGSYTLDGLLSPRPVTQVKSSPEGRCCLAWECAEAGHYAKALYHLKKAWEISPICWVVYYVRAYIKSLQGETKDAIDDLKTFITHCPNITYGNKKKLVANAYEWLGQLYFDEKEYVNAIECFKKAIEQDEDNIDAFTCLIDSLCLCGQYEKGLDVARVAIRKFPEDWKAYLNCVRCYSLLGASDTAVEYFESACVKGFTFFADMLDDPSFDSLTKHHRFREIVKKYTPDDTCINENVRVFHPSFGDGVVKGILKKGNERNKWIIMVAFDTDGIKKLMWGPALKSGLRRKQVI